MQPEIEKLKNWVEQSDNIVFFGGAGVSTESGIPDFRSVDGLYNQQYQYPPETILSATFFQRDPEEFYRFYHAKLVVSPDVKPNAAHRWLAALEREGKLKAVITQNIDGLHQKAGSREVLELHGTTHRCYCARCRKPYSEAFVNECAGVPRCDCGGVVRPDVVLYEEALDQTVLEKAIRYIQAADMLIVGGTSLVVYPAAGLIHYYQGHKLVLVNRGQTTKDEYADLVVRGRIGEVFSQL